VWRGYGDLVTGLAGRAPASWCCQEKIAALAPEEADRRQAQLSALAQRAGVHLVAGVQDEPLLTAKKRFLAVQSAGELLAEYREQHAGSLPGDDLNREEDLVRTLDGAPFGPADLPRY